MKNVQLRRGGFVVIFSR